MFHTSTIIDCFALFFLLSENRQLDEGPDYRPMLKQIQSSGESHVSCFVDKIM